MEKDCLRCDIKDCPYVTVREGFAYVDHERLEIRICNSVPCAYSLEQLLIKLINRLEDN